MVPALVSWYIWLVLMYCKIWRVLFFEVSGELFFWKKSVGNPVFLKTGAEWSKGGPKPPFFREKGAPTKFLIQKCTDWVSLWYWLVNLEEPYVDYPAQPRLICSSLPVHLSVLRVRVRVQQIPSIIEFEINHKPLPLASVSKWVAHVQLKKC